MPSCPGARVRSYGGAQGGPQASLVKILLNSDKLGYMVVYVPARWLSGRGVHKPEYQSRLRQECQ